MSFPLQRPILARIHTLASPFWGSLLSNVFVFIFIMYVPGISDKDYTVVSHINLYWNRESDKKRCGIQRRHSRYIAKSCRCCHDLTRWCVHCLSCLSFPLNCLNVRYIGFLLASVFEKLKICGTPIRSHLSSLWLAGIVTGNIHTRDISPFQAR
jgi:hypothetical protein